MFISLNEARVTARRVLWMVPRGVVVSMALVLGAFSAQAATLTSSGATGLVVNGTSYDVEFLDGTCIALFSGCDETSDFTFRNLSDANAAASALLALFDATPAFDADPTLINGCERAEVCRIQILYSIQFDYGQPGRTVATSVDVINYRSTYPDVIGKLYIDDDYDSTLGYGRNLARFTASSVSPVPLPAGGWLLLAGLTGVAGLRFRKKRTAQV